MEFICTHCEKVISCSAKLINGNFLHVGCEIPFNEAKKKYDLESLFEEGGLLHGVKPMSPEKSERIEKLYGCCKSTLLNEE